MKKITKKEALVKAKEHLKLCKHMSENGGNEGLKAIYRNQAEWLTVIIQLAAKAEKPDKKENISFLTQVKKSIFNLFE